MTPEQFTHWLRGVSAVVGDAPSPEQWETVLEALGKVTQPVSPYANVPPPLQLRNPQPAQPLKAWYGDPVQQAQCAQWFEK
ncbi:MAG TPA: hypothetical protein VFM34_03220 [Moraxellaceae bacterium]|nr:hypothetical protein [Moraxellaceae bacterium]